MIKINLITVGDIKEKYLKDAIEEYKKRLVRFCSLKIVEIKENISTSQNENDIINALKKDAVLIKKYLKGYCICLCVEGKQLSSTEFANLISNTALSNSEITFVIGASNGIADEIKNMANFKLSFGKMTYPHQLMRVIALEQIYRAFTILNNIAYHK